MVMLDAFDCQILIITCFVIGCSNIWIDHWVNSLIKDKGQTKNDAIKGSLKTLRSIFSLFAYTSLACTAFTLFYYADQAPLMVDGHFMFGILGTLVSISVTILVYRRIQYLINQVS